MSSKRVLIVSECFFPENFMVNDLAETWVQQGKFVEVLTRVPSYPFGKVFAGYTNKIYQKERKGEITIHRVQTIEGYRESVKVKVLNYIWNAILASVVAIRIGKRFDQIFIYQTGPLTFSAAGIIIKKIHHIPVTIWTQDIWPDSVYAFGFKEKGIKKWMLDRFVSWVYTNCDHILVSCKGFETKIKKFTTGGLINYVPNWALLEESCSQDMYVGFRRGINFTFTGNVGKMQNLENVILGFEKFTESRPEISCYLNIIGDGSHLEKLKILCQENNYQNVIFYGRKPLNLMIAFFNESDVLVLSLIDSPIFSITVPAKFQTYLTARKPIFGIIKGDAKQLIDDNGIGFTASPSDVNSIAEGFKKFIDLTNEDKKQMAGKSNHLLESEFDRNTIINKITKVVFSDP